MALDDSYKDFWFSHTSVAHGRDLEMSLGHFALFKDHIYIYYVRFGGGHVGPDDGYEDVWDIHASVVHDRGLEMSS